MIPFEPGWARADSVAGVGVSQSVGAGWIANWRSLQSPSPRSSVLLSGKTTQTPAKLLRCSSTLPGIRGPWLRTTNCTSAPRGLMSPWSSPRNRSVRRRSRDSCSPLRRRRAGVVEHDPPQGPNVAGSEAAGGEPCPERSSRISRTSLRFGHRRRPRRELRTPSWTTPRWRFRRSSRRVLLRWRPQSFSEHRAVCSSARHQLVVVLLSSSLISR